MGVKSGGGRKWIGNWNALKNDNWENGVIGSRCRSFGMEFRDYADVITRKRFEPLD